MSRGARTLLLLVSLLLSWSLPTSPALSNWSGPAAERAEADAEDSGCETPCPGDDENGDCPPQCDACPCCPSATGQAGVSGAPPASVARPLAHLAAPSSSGSPQDGALSRVFHPPRAARS